MVADAVEKFGRLDVMVNNAGMEIEMPFLGTPPEAGRRCWPST
jgi:NAD(P)-dependent dehydrogenase (short-subunit alcohol dehydrogenase family)